MPIRWIINREYTITGNETQYWSWNFFGSRPNQGPITFRAVPKGRSGGNNTARNVLVTYDVAICRGGPGDTNAPEVFYTFKIRNESTITVPFVLEFILFTDSPIKQG